MNELEVIYRLDYLSLAGAWLKGFWTKSEIRYIRNRTPITRGKPKNLSLVKDFSLFDEWIECAEAAFEQAKTLYESPYPCPQFERLKRYHLQHSFIEFEAKCLEDWLTYLKLTELNAPAKLSSGFLTHPLTKHRCSFTIFTVLDTISHWIEAQATLLYHTVTCLRNLFYSQIQPEYLDGLIRGISPMEIPKSELSISCFWFSDGHIMPFQKFAYFIEHDLKKTLSDDLLKKHKVFSSADLFQGLPIPDRIKIFTSLLGQMSLNLVLFDRASFFVSKSLFRSCLWKSFARTTRLKWVLSTISETCPSPPELEGLRNIGVRTAVWSYSHFANLPSKNRPAKDESLLLSLSNYQSIITWSEATKAFFKKAQINNYYDPFVKNYFISGVTLNSRKENFNKGRTELMRQLGIKFDPELFYISAFDLPAWKPEPRLANALAPFMTGPAQEMFFRDLIRLLSDEPNARLIIKPKRYRLPHLEELPSMEELLSLSKVNNPQVIVLAPDVDPTLIILSSDFTITSFFTSPSLIADFFEVPAAFYEPSGYLAKTGSSYLQSLLITNYAGLLWRIGTAKQVISRNRHNKFDFKNYLQTLKEAFNQSLS